MDMRDTPKGEQQPRRAPGEPQRKVPSRPPSFAERTGQSRRLVVARSISILGGLGIFVGWSRGADGVWVSLLSTLVGAIGFIWMCLAVRCPRCRTAVVWYAFRTKSFRSAQREAMDQVACPSCGFEPPLSGSREAALD